MASTSEEVPHEEALNIQYSAYQDERQLPSIMTMMEKELSEPYSIYTYRYFIHGWPTLCIRATIEEKLIGVIVCKADRKNRKKVLRGYIAMLAVEHEYRRHGIGSKLAVLAIEEMKRMGCDEAVLETEITNKGAMRLSERLGFLRDKRLCKYYLNGVDAFRLKLYFSPPVVVNPFAEVVPPQGATPEA